MGWLNLGAWGAFGLLLGVAVVVWAEPQTTGGAGVLLLICVAVAVLLRGVWQTLTPPSNP